MCFAVALGLGGNGVEQEIALRNLIAVQADFLATQASEQESVSTECAYPQEGTQSASPPPSEDIRRVWLSLVELMRGYNMTTASEMMGLKSPFDV